MKIKIFLFTLLSLSMATASFYQGQLRYISGYEFKQRLSDIGIKFTSNTYCLGFEFFNQSSFPNLGANPAALGKPLFLSPTAGTIQEISDCVAYNMQLQTTAYSEEDLDVFISDELSQAIRKKYPQYRSKRTQLNMQWSLVPVQEKYFFIRNLVEKTLGTDPVIEDYGLVLSAEALRNEILQQLESRGSTLSLEQVIRQVVITLILRDEFLSY